MPHVVIEEALDLAVACQSVQLTAVRNGSEILNVRDRSGPAAPWGRVVHYTFADRPYIWPIREGPLHEPGATAAVEARVCRPSQRSRRRASRSRGRPPRARAERPDPSSTRSHPAKRPRPPNRHRRQRSGGGRRRPRDMPSMCNPKFKSAWKLNWIPSGDVAWMPKPSFSCLGATQILPKHPSSRPQSR